MDRAQKLLLDYGLRKTGCRQEVLRQFLQNDFALSHADLEKLIGDRYDRVTIYRTLYSFEEKGLIHSINDVSGAVKFALCQEEACSQQHHHDNHIHFNCTSCGQTFCLNEVNIPAISLPNAYKVERLHFSAQGTCKDCDKAVAK
ncbi:Fur family transcriptional regulator [Pontibacter rugosus]|uniref:Fur family transcriptional regulator n=1 Tax=Pontibacter rugosus TaxID=1745966 RepID=A0ABW3SLZ9_9BACT